MEQLHQAIQDAFSKIVASGAIEKAIETKLEKAISDMLDEQLRSYGDFGKALKEKVSAAMQIDVERMDLPSYGHFIEKIIARSVDDQLKGDVAKKVQENMSALLAGAPEEITIEKLVDDFKQHVKDRAYGGEIDSYITLHVKATDYGYWHIAMDKDSGKEEYRCDFRLGLNDKGEIYNLKIDDEDMNKELFIRPARGFERDLYRMFVSGTKIKIEAGTDRHDFDTSMYAD